MFQLPFPTQDANTGSGGVNSDGPMGDLPEWNLDDLYTGEDAPELTRDLEWLEAECASFAVDYENKLASLDANGLLDCVLRNEKINQVAGRIMSYAGLRYYQTTTDASRAKFMSDAQEKITNHTTPLVFFTLELNTLDDDHMEALLAANADLARYKPVFDRIRAMKKYQLSDELEKFMHDLGVVGDAWERLFDETIAGLEFNVEGELLNIEGTLNLLTGRHLSNDVEPEVVEALRNAVVAAYPKLSHRYYELKRKWLGLDVMQVWDRNAPLPMEDTRIVDWATAEDMVMSAYNAFDQRMGELAAPFFSDGWIDAGVKPGKAPGAFAHPTVTNVHPYVMLNYLGKPRDVMTLAHELGHGVHQVLAAEQGEMLSSTPLTLAETASVFGEMLTFRKMLDGAETKSERRILLAGKVEDMINTVVRQIAFYDFECKLHAARAQGELTPENINDIWMSVQGESLGPAFEFMDGYETFWAYIPHFVHSPFYVYAYAFGDGLVNALYAVYAEGDEGFEDKYFEMLKAGGSKHHKELLAPFGLDASDPKFWDKGLSMISGFIDELEAMED